MDGSRLGLGMVWCGGDLASRKGPISCFSPPLFTARVGPCCALGRRYRVDDTGSTARSGRREQDRRVVVRLRIK
jgi:hypothetical protein